jgi:hypothetical protein
MSLINDALKRAKEAQQDAAPPPAPNLQLRPIEPSQCTRQSLGLVTPVAFALIALLLLFFIWQRSQRHSPAQTPEVHARTALPAAPAAAPAPAPVPTAPVPTPPAPETPPAPLAASATTPAEALGPLAVPGLSSPGSVTSESAVTNATVAADAPLPKPVLPKLQAIVFSRTRPSVMVSGKTLFVGDKLNGLRVAAIDQESVTLIGAGQTNVLTLPE